jgi:hypothetical protein
VVFGHPPSYKSLPDSRLVEFFKNAEGQIISNGQKQTVENVK